MNSDILVIEDDENLRLALVDNLLDEGYRVRGAGSIAEALASIEEGKPDLMILDIMLPDGDGYTFCAERRADGDDTPIIMLTARTLEEDLLRGFRAGADDYVAKPYRLAEMLARVAAVLRRRSGEAPEPKPGKNLGPFVIDRRARNVEGPDGLVNLTKTEFDLLAFLLENEGCALTRDRILDAVWGEDIVVDTRTVDNFVSSLKKKLEWSEGCGWAITTIRGVGYRMELEG
jgi:DNA-binding response OmpR family regulator